MDFSVSHHIRAAAVGYGVTEMGANGVRLW